MSEESQEMELRERSCYRHLTFLKLPFENNSFFSSPGKLYDPTKVVHTAESRKVSFPTRHTFENTFSPEHTHKRTETRTNSLAFITFMY